MSGLCGWFAAQPAPIAIERMASPIGRFERTPLKSAASGRAAVALSGSIDHTSLFHEDGLIVALWGSPGQQASLLAQRWRSHGAHACAALAGHFAFAILDECAGEALLAVDRFATRPLYFHACSGSGDLLFASSQDALLRHPLAGRTASAPSLYTYLVLGSMGGSAWEGQQQLGPGECLHLRGGRAVRHTWWRMRFHEHGTGSRQDLEAALQAGARQAQGEPRAGVMLSGGAGSAALAAQLQAPGTAPPATFSVVYANGPHAPAANPARQAAQLLASRHHEQVVRPADVVDAIPKLAALSDTPCGATSAVAHHYCGALARAQGVLRLANGAGVRELFGAGPLSVQQRHWARYAALPAALRELVLEPLLVHLHATALADQARRDVPARIVHASAFGAAHAAPMLAPEFRAQIDPGAPLAALRQLWWGAQCRSDTNRTIALDLRLSLPARLAASQLGCALAGVDVAYPWLEETVVAAAAQLAPHGKLPGRAAPHARALRALLPGPLARRTARATLPLVAWLQADPDLRALAFDSLHDLRRRHIVADSVIDGLLSTSMAAPGPGFGNMVWRLMMLEQWFLYRAPHVLLGTSAPLTASTAPVQACPADEPAPAGQAI
ncbi:asparagine synthase-related protein [Massilia sp. S19_KUP03_FR1]|uniref:asparagine synthase-related protein n=1 Tax=Massilia sp. S19_KUP03_FR1 TaxID=3025503 RepID=UPI002FCD9C48